MFDMATKLESWIMVILYIDLKPGSSKHGHDFLASIYSSCEVMSHLKLIFDLKLIKELS